MSYVSFSLKYRPQRFEDVIGQEHVSRTLMNAVRAGRIAHAYLFSGPRGTGKTSSARVLAKALNCEHGPTPEPCGVCEFCRAVQEGRALDVIEIDAASNRGIDEIRDLREKVKYSPAEARAKVYILDEVHMLTSEAFNALLKTLEEPPAHSFFVLATTELHKVPATILSRCQRFDFRQIPVGKIAAALAQIAQREGIIAEPAALESIARAADGAMRDAESIFDQVVAFTEGDVTLAVVDSVLGVTDSETLAQITDAIVAGDVAASFDLVDQIMGAGKDVGQLLSDLTIYLRDLMRIVLGSRPSAWRLPGPEGQARSQAQAQALGVDRLLDAVNALAEAQSSLRSSSQHSLVLELTLAKLCSAPEPATKGKKAPARPAAAPSVPAAAQTPEPQPDRPGAAAEPSAPAATAAPPAPPAAEAPPTPAPAEQRPATTPEQPAEAAATAQPAAPEMPPAQPVTTGEVDITVVQQHWHELPAELRRMGKMAVGAFVTEAWPEALAGDALSLVFKPDFAFHHSQVTGGYKDVVQQALERLYGRPMTVRARLAAPGEDLPLQAPPAVAPAPPAETAPPTAPAPEPEPSADAEPEASAVPADTAPSEPHTESSEEQTPTAADKAPDTPAAEDDKSPVDRVVAQALNLFEGSRLLGDDE